MWNVGGNAKYLSVKKYETLKYIVWPCEMQNPIQYSWHGMENFPIEHTNNRKNFFWKNLTTDISHLTFNTSKHIIKYLRLSMFFVDGLPNLATLTIKIFNHFIKKHLIQFKHVNLFQNFQWLNNWVQKLILTEIMNINIELQILALFWSTICDRLWI